MVGRAFRAALVSVALGLISPGVARANFDWVGRVELAADGLGADDPKDRLDAVTDLSNYDVAYTAPHLLKALRDEDVEVRLEAGRVLGRGGAMAAVGPVIEWLADPDAKTRAVAADILGDLGGPEATGALIRTLGDTDGTVRVRTVAALGKIGSHGDLSVVVPLISRIEDDKADVRRMAIEQLEALKDPRAIIPLVAGFGDTSLEVRKAAVRAVGVIGDRSAVPALLRLLNDPAEEVRTLAVGALGSLGATDAVDTLIELLGTGSDPFRAKVTYGLGQIAKATDSTAIRDAAVTALVQSLSTPNLRTAAREALAVAGKAAVPALVASLEGRGEGDPATAVTLLRDAADPRATAALIAELDRGRVPTAAVLEALSATGDPQALLPVLGLLAAKDGATRLAAMTALRPLLGRDPRAADVLLERLADDDLELRVLAVEYLGLLHTGRAIDKLATLTGAGNAPRLRRAAIDAIGEIGDARGADALLAVLRDGPVELHRAVADALSYLAAPASAEPLYSLAAADHGPSRHHVVRALGAVLRGRPDPRAATLLLGLSRDARVPVSLAAIGALAAIGDAGAAPGLSELARDAGPDRRRAAVAALGELRVPAAVGLLTAAAGDRDDRVAGDAAWALGEIAAGGAAGWTAVATPEVTARLAAALKRGGWARAIDASAALARIVTAAPAGKARTALGADATAALELGLHHASRLVRLNASRAIGATAAAGGRPSATVLAALAQLATDDGSPWVRAAATHALRVAGDPARLPDAARGALAHAAADGDAAVQRAAAGAVVPTAREEWRSFYVVDPEADDGPVRQEPYFIVGSDGLAWATYTDARGELASEHFPTGDAVVAARSHEADY